MKDDSYPDEQAVQQAYDSFINKIHLGEYRQAFEILKKTPNLMIHVSPLNAAMAHDEFRKFVGEKEADYLFILFAKEFRDTVSGMDAANLLASWQEDLGLEEFLSGIDEKHKKLLEDMEFL